MKYEGIRYSKPAVVILNVEDDYPQFGKIHNIFITSNNDIVLYVNLCNTVKFDTHYHLYVISSTNNFQTVSISSLYSPYPLHFRRVSCQNSSIQGVVMKYHIYGTLH